MSDLNPDACCGIDKTYAGGVVDGRRTAEAEFAAERHAVATIANAMIALSDEIVLVLNPRDIELIGGDFLEIRTMADEALPQGAVRAEIGQ